MMLNDDDGDGGDLVFLVTRALRSQGAAAAGCVVRARLPLARSLAHARAQTRRHCRRGCMVDAHFRYFTSFYGPALWLSYNLQ